ncbi:hypothetical protein PVK06_023542 [Gossypium arboreum]|uniref:Uncharacterized protein n=1 Tax=Gossypium arboreum TaxID=29729 RepID=A0ABR0PBE3_GOSAR|nr:hypothetical protein PVK06_023542 [Gossypium arboreum]
MSIWACASRWKHNGLFISKKRFEKRGKCLPERSGDKKGGRKLKGFGVLRVRDEDRLLGFMKSATGRDLTLGSHHQQSCGKRSVGIRDTGSVVSVSLVAEHQRKRKVDKLGNVDVYYASVE